MQTLNMALQTHSDVQAIIGETVMLVRDFTRYEQGGYLVKVHVEDPESLYTHYSTLDEIEPVLARTVPGYAEGCALWEKYDETWPWVHDSLPVED